MSNVTPMPQKPELAGLFGGTTAALDRLTCDRTTAPDLTPAERAEVDRFGIHDEDKGNPAQ